MLKKGDACRPFSPYFFPNGCDLPRRSCIRGVQEPRGSQVPATAERYAALHVQTRAQVSRSVRDEK